MSERLNPQRDLLAASAKRLLDQSVHDLDQQTTLLVQRARLNVLDRGSPRRPWLQWAGGMVLASVVGLSLTLWIWPSTSPAGAHGAVERPPSFPCCISRRKAGRAPGSATEVIGRAHYSPLSCC